MSPLAVIAIFSGTMNLLLAYFLVATRRQLAKSLKLTDRALFLLQDRT